MRVICKVKLKGSGRMSTQMVSGPVQIGQSQMQSTGETGVLVDHGFEIIDFEDTKETDKKDDNKSDVNDLVGCRLEFQWTSGKWYRGTICKYNNEKRLHHVLYDDGEEKWYYLPEMVFRFVKEEEEWIKC